MPLKNPTFLDDNAAYRWRDKMLAEKGANGMPTQQNMDILMSEDRG